MPNLRQYTGQYCQLGFCDNIKHQQITKLGFYEPVKDK